MGLNRQLANLPDAITTDTSNNVGIGGAANASFKLQVTGSGAFNGGATGLILSLDANVSVAKSISFRSNNSPRMSVEVSGTESGSNTGANFQIKRFSDAGSLIDTPFEISRETGNSTFFSDYLFLAKNQNGFTNFYIENTTGGTASGGGYIIRSDFGSDFAQFGKFSTLTTAIGIRSPKDAFMITDNGSIAILTSDATGTIKMAAGNSSTAHLTIASTGAATFSGKIGIGATPYASTTAIIRAVSATSTNYALIIEDNASNQLFEIKNNGAATFSSSVTATDILTINGSSSGKVLKLNSKDNLGDNYIEFNQNDGTRQGYIGYGYSGYNYMEIYQSANEPIIFSTNTTERIKILSGGNTEIYNSLSVGTTIGSNIRLYVKGGDTTSSNYALDVQNSSSVDLFYVRNDGLIVTGGTTASPYNNTNAAAANLFVGTSGILYRSTASSKRFKEEIKDWDASGLDTILALKPKTFKYKKDYYDKADVDFLGLIAEDVSEICPYLVDYENQDRTGEVENVRYANIVVPLIKAIQEQNQTITSLQEQINELKNK